MGKGPVGRVHIGQSFCGQSSRICIHHLGIQFYYANLKYFRLNYSSSRLIMFSSKLCHTEDGSYGKYPVKTCCVSDDLSGDMLALSWPNLVNLQLHNF